MGSPPTIDFQRLLQPIPGNSPARIDLRTKASDSHESIYWQLRSAGNLSGEIERKRSWIESTFFGRRSRECIGRELFFRIHSHIALVAALIPIILLPAACLPHKADIN